MDISNQMARIIHGNVQVKHGFSRRKKFMTVEAKDEYNKIIRRLQKK